MSFFRNLFSRSTNNTPDAPKPVKQEEQSPKHFQIDSAEDAKKLLQLCEFNEYRMKNQYDSETCRNFSRFAESSLKKQWAADYCTELLNGIKNGISGDISQGLSKFNNICDYYISSDCFIELYTDVWRNLFSSGKKVPTVLIKDYLKLFTGRFSKSAPEAEELIKLTLSQIEHEEPSYSIDELKRTCIAVRGIISDMNGADSSFNFEFALTEPSVIETLRNYYLDKYNGDNEAAKEDSACLNCYYGVKNYSIFLTASSDAADSSFYHSWDIYEFAAVFFAEDTASVFRCKRGEDGRFVIEKGYKVSEPLLEKYEPVISAAISFYRNKEESDKFRDKLSSQMGDGYSFNKERFKADSELQKSFGSSFGYLLEHIPDNSLSDVLKMLVDFCEENAPRHGLKNTFFGEPATAEEIEACEKRIGMALPESIKEFLAFANGAQIINCSDVLHGTAKICNNEYIGDEYLLIGSIIGDGTMLCCRKSDGCCGEFDHETGDFRSFGNYGGMLEYIMDLNE